MDASTTARHLRFYWGPEATAHQSSNYRADRHLDTVFVARGMLRQRTPAPELLRLVVVLMYRVIVHQQKSKRGI